MLFSFSARAMALGARVSDNPALAITPGAGGYIGKLPEKALLHSLDFPVAVTLGASTGRASRSGSAAVAVRALLQTIYSDIYTATKRCFFKSNRYLLV
jgi:hypothetical protein